MRPLIAYQPVVPLLVVETVSAPRTVGESIAVDPHDLLTLKSRAVAHSDQCLEHLFDTPRGYAELSVIVLIVVPRCGVR